MEDKRVEFPVDKIPNHPIFDIGTETITEYAGYIRKAETLFANGPAGVFEKEEFNIGTDDILNAIASSPRIFNYRWRPSCSCSQSDGSFKGNKPYK